MRVLIDNTVGCCVTISKCFRAGFWILLLSICSAISFGQEPIFKSYEIEKGLLSNETHFTLSDSKGYVWVASDAGINKFDGHTFKSFTEMDGLPESSILRLYEDKNGRIWFSTLSSWVGYIENDRVKVLPYKFKDELNSNSDNFAYSLYVDKGDTLWVGTIYSGLLFKMAPPYKTPPTIRHFKSDFIMEFNEGGEYVYGTLSQTGSKVIRLEQIKKWCNSSKTYTTLGELPGRRKHIIRLAKDHYIFECLKDLYSIEKGEIKHLRSFQNPIVFMGIQKTNQLWVSVLTNGLYIFENLNVNKVPKPYYPGIVLTWVSTDFEGGHWFSSLLDGVVYVPNIEFKSFYKGSSFQDVYVESPQSILLNESFGNLLIRDHKNTSKIGLFAVNIFPMNHLVLYSSTSDIQQIYNRKNGIKSALKINDPQDRVVILKSFSRFKDKLIGWHNYLLFVADTSNLEFNFLKATDSRINCAIMSSQSIIWVGTINGLLHYNVKTNKLTNYSKFHPLLGSRVDKINIDKHGDLWLATRGQGLLHYSPKNNRLQKITTANGLSSNIILAMDFDAQSNLWVGTNAGLCRIAKRVKDGVNITDFSYLNNFEIGTIRSIDVNQNKVYLATSNGVFVFPVNQLFRNSKLTKVPLYFTSVTTNKGREIGTTVVLPYNENSLIINFLGISYKRSKEVYYEYKLDGFHSKWFRTKNQSVELLNIPPGSYIFKVRSMVGGTVLSQSELVFEIEIPFWKSWWFYSIVVLFFAGIIWLVVRWRIRTIRRTEQEKSDLKISFAHLESQALRAQMNPHFIFNSLNSIQRIYTEGNLQEANAYLSEFGQLIRKILENSGRTVIPLKEEIETLELYLNLEQFRCKNKFTYSIEIDASIDQYYMKIPSLIIQPFVENAIWHGVIPSERDGIIVISCSIVDDGIKVSVKDNGVGITKSKKSTHISKGIEITEKRIANKIQIVSAPGEGTEVWFILKGNND